MNFLIVGLAALIPLVTGAIWYSPATFAKTWMKVSGVPEEKLKSGNMILIFGLTLLLGFFIALLLSSMVIHQNHIFSILLDEPGFGQEGSDVQNYFNDFMAKYGQHYRSFKHGALHGTITGLLFVTPIISIISLFERRGFKYIAIHSGYWILTLLLMGGVICAFS